METVDQKSSGSATALLVQPYSVQVPLSYASPYALHFAYFLQYSTSPMNNVFRMGHVVYTSVFSYAKYAFSMSSCFSVYRLKVTQRVGADGKYRTELRLFNDY